MLKQRTVHNTTTQTQFVSTGRPSLLGKQSRCGMKNLSDISTHDQQLEMNLRSFDLESSPLSTTPHDSICHVQPLS